MGDAVGPLAREWRHEGHSLDRELVKGGLVRESLQDRDPETKELLRRVDLDEETLVVSVEGDRASLEVEASFSRLREGAWETTWRALVFGELAELFEGACKYPTTASETPTFKKMNERTKKYTSVTLTGSF